MEITTIIIDTDAYAAFKRGFHDAIDIVRQASCIIINPIVMGELSEGFLFMNNTEKHKQELDLFLTSPRVQTVNIEKDTTLYYSKIFKQLTEKHCPIPTNNIWVAASAMQYNAIIFSFDKSYKEIEGVRVVAKL